MQSGANYFVSTSFLTGIGVAVGFNGSRGQLSPAGDGVG
jgi:hypothetical protein